MDDQIDSLGALTARLSPGNSTFAPRGEVPNVQSAFTIMTSKRWRRSALSDDSASDIRSKIENALNGERELVFTIPFGGYKSWRISSSPLPNWAEIFFVDYLRRFLRDVGAVFPFGVRAEFTYISGVMDLVSNHHPTWQPSYVAEMARLLSYYSDEPGQMSIVDISALPGAADVRAAVARNYETINGDWDPAKLSDDQAKKLHSAERNFAVHGAEDFGYVSSGELERLVFTSAIMCDALDSMLDRRTYNKFGPRIQLVFGRDPQPALHIGSCETSTVHFWVSEGVLERHGNRVLPRMIGHSSVETPSVADRQVELVDLDSYRANVGSWLPSTCKLI